MSLGDAQRLPTYQRLWFMERTAKEFEAMAAETKKAQQKSKSGKR